MIFVRTRSPARTWLARSSFTCISANIEMWHKPDRPDPSKVTNTPYDCTLRTVPMTTSPTFNDASASLFGVLESDCEVRSDISTRFVFASAETMRPRTNRPVGNSTDGFSTKPSARLVSFISASKLRESATKHPALPTDLTYPETSFPTSRLLAS